MAATKWLTVPHIQELDVNWVIRSLAVWELNHLQKHPKTVTNYMCTSKSPPIKMNQQNSLIKYKGIELHSD